VKVQGSSVVVTCASPGRRSPSRSPASPGWWRRRRRSGRSRTLPVGTGPFRVRAASLGRGQLARNSTYWQPDRPYLGASTCPSSGRARSRRTAFGAGQVDVALLTDPGAVEQVAAGAGIIQASQALVRQSSSTRPRLHSTTCAAASPGPRSIGPQSALRCSGQGEGGLLVHPPALALGRPRHGAGSGRRPGRRSRWRPSARRSA
jgi:hypothetical protein